MIPHDINRVIAEGLVRSGLRDLAYDKDKVGCSKGHEFSADAPFAPRVGARCPYDRICDGIIQDVPCDFSHPEWFYPAFEVWCAEYQMAFLCTPSDGGAVWNATIRHAIRTDEQFDGDGPTFLLALQDAWVAALTSLSKGDFPND